MVWWKSSTRFHEKVIVYMLFVWVDFVTFHKLKLKPMRTLLLLILSSFIFSEFLFGQSSHFTNWERISFDGKSLGEVYFKNDKLVTLQPTKGVFTSIDQGKSWQLEYEFHPNVDVPSNKIVVNNDGMYITKKSTIPDAYTSPKVSQILINENGERSLLNSYANSYNFCCTSNSSSQSYGFNGSSAITSRHTEMGVPDKYYYRIFDGISHTVIEVDDKPAEQFLGRVGDRFLWKTSNTYFLLDSLYSNEVIQISPNLTSDILLVYPEHILILNRDGRYDILDANSLNMLSGEIDLNNEISNAALTSDNILQLLLGQQIFHVDLLISETAELRLASNNNNFKILVVTPEWVLGRNAEGKLALTMDGGITWELYYPEGLDFVSQLKRLDDEIIFKNHNKNYYSDCDVQFFPSTIDLNNETIIFDGVILQLIDDDVFAFFGSNTPGIKMTNFPADVSLVGFLVHENELFAYGNRLEKIDIENVSTSTVSNFFNADKAKSYNGIMYTIRGDGFNRLNSLYFETELFSHYSIHDFYVDESGIGIFGSSFYFSEDGGENFVEFGAPEIELNAWSKKRELLIGKSVEQCDRYGVVSLDAGISWDNFQVPDVAAFDPVGWEWSCGGQQAMGLVKFGFSTDEAYLYALGGNHGVYRTPLYSNYETITAIDSVIHFCEQDSILLNDVWYNSSDTIFVVVSDEFNCEKVIAAELIPVGELFDTMYVGLTSGETFLDVLITNDTMLTESVGLGSGCLHTTTYFVAVITKTNDLGIDNKINLFPNPTNSGQLFIEWESEVKFSQLNFYNAAGIKLFSTNLTGTSGKYEMNINEVPSGTYYVQMISENGIVAKSVIKL